MLRQIDHSGQGDEQQSVLKAEISIPEHLQDSLRSARFIDCLFITRCNEPVGAYALQRARLFGKANRRQLLWIQAEDYLDDPHFSD